MWLLAAVDTSCRALLNGSPAHHWPLDDRGCQYGDGVFRTLRVENGWPRWWPDHLLKLRQDADRLGIPCPGDPVWEADVAQLLDRDTEAVLKLVLTRGGGPRGYRPPAGGQSNRLVSLAPLPEHTRRPTARLRVCQLRLAEQPRLAGIKHLNRLEQVLARMEWDDPDIDEGLLLDATGRVISGVSANLFIHLDGELLTPRLERCGVAGVTRARVLRAAVRLGLPTRETDLTLDQVRAAAEVLLTNSLVGVWPVAWLEGRVWSDHTLARQLQGALDD